MQMSSATEDQRFQQNEDSHSDSAEACNPADAGTEEGVMYDRECTSSAAHMACNDVGRRR